MTLALLSYQRRVELWGPDAEKFDPERWLDERLSYFKANPFIFTVSRLAGRRLSAQADWLNFCSPSRGDLESALASSLVSGLNYTALSFPDLKNVSTAYNEASFALIRLLQVFDRISLAPDVQPPSSQTGDGGVLLSTQITLFFKGGLWVRLQEAERTA